MVLIVTLPETEFPWGLEDGKIALARFTYEQIVHSLKHKNHEGLARLSGRCILSTGEVFRGSELTFDMTKNEFLKLDW